MGERVIATTRRVAIIAGIIGSAALPNSAAAEGGPVTCRGSVATIVGTPKPDELEGTPGNDVFAGLGGDDVIRGLGGHDQLCGDRGDDELSNQVGYDHVSSFYGGAGQDYLRGHGGLTGDKGDDVIEGESPTTSSSYRPDPGDDLIVDLDGEGWIDYGRSPVGLHADLREGTVSGWGNDEVWGMQRFSGSQFDDVILGTDAGEVINGGGGRGYVNGRGGADLVENDGIVAGGPGDDRLQLTNWRNDDVTIVRGGSGIDRTTYNRPVHVNLRKGIGRIQEPGQAAHRLRSVENLFATDSGSVLIGDEAPNELLSYGGSAVLRGRGGSDVLGPPQLAIGPMGDLSLYGGTGNDVLHGANAEDVLHGGGDDDQLLGEWSFQSLSSADDDFLNGGAGVDDLDGGDGTDECLKGEAVTDCES